MKLICPTSRLRFAGNFHHFVRISARSPSYPLRDFRPQRRPLENYASGQGNNEWPAGAAAGKIHALLLSVQTVERVASAVVEAAAAAAVAAM